MVPVLFAHPFSSYCQKVLIALYENATPFEGVTNTAETAVTAIDGEASKASGDTPKLRTRLKQKVKSFLSVFRSGRH